MTTGTLALIIATLLITQAAALLLTGYYRRWQKHKAEPGQVAPPLTAPPSSRAELLRPGGEQTWSGFREFEVQRRVYEDGDRQICSFYLAPVDGRPLPPFQPGQFLTFRLSVEGPGGGQTLTRCYSLSDRPRSDCYRVSIKRVPGSTGAEGLPPGRSSNYFHDHVEPGSRLQVKAPAGQFHLDQESDRPLVLVGGGIGITPMLSMLEHLLETGSRRETWLFYGVRNGVEMVMQPRLQQLAEQHPYFHLYSCFSQPLESDRPGIDYQHRGRVDIDLLRNTLPMAGYQFYLCGPQPMMQSLVPDLEALGIHPADIHYEAFGPASIPGKKPHAPAQQADSDIAFEVRFSKSGRRVTWQPGAGSLLELAEAEGIEVDSGCRAGSCGVCQTRLESGEVGYDTPPDADIESGHCLLCKSKPKGDLVLQL
ncbi:MAG: 2Fe-2S iron-sulfur cluster-binding protein [Sedimenticola sp.]|nr:2Fe-2S iron-sulfur cluster-binding protein [Sedimenticola sp.]